MPRRKNQFTTGHYYHVYNRGANRERIFFNENNYLHLLKLVKKYCQKYLITAIAYCLMPNHYHFLLRQDGEVTISRFTGTLFNAYAQALNKQTGRSGALFEGRFKDVHVDDAAYLLHLCRYIHGNPVKAGLVTMPEEWLYSNYLDWIGERPGKLIDHDFVNDFFLNLQDYKEFVLDYLRGIDELPSDIKRYLFE